MDLDKLSETHTDTVDASIEISLHEYGLARNPKTHETVFCVNPSSEYENGDVFQDMTVWEFKYRYDEISLDDVIEALHDAGPGYFSFIGSDLETELSELDNDFLSHHIMSLNMYNGHFTPLY